MRYRELMAATLHGGASGLFPVSAWQHHPVADQDTNSLVEATLGFHKNQDFDFVKLTPASTWQSHDRGLQDLWAGDFIGRREVMGQTIRSVEDWSDLKALNPFSGFTGKIVAAAARLRSRLPSHIPVIATVFNPVFQASQLRGFDALRDDMLQAPQLVRTALDHLSNDTERTIQALRDAGVDGIFFATQQAQEAVADEILWKAISLSNDISCLAACDGLPFNFMHLHGSKVHTSLYRNCSVVMHYDHGASNPHPRTLAGAFPAGLSTGPGAETTLLKAHPHKIDEEVVALRRSMVGQRFILCPGCSVPVTTAQAQIDAFAQAARRPLQNAA